MEIWWK